MAESDTQEFCFMRTIFSMRNLGRCVNADWVDRWWIPLLSKDFSMVRKTDSLFPLLTHNTWVMLGFIICQWFFSHNLIFSLLQSNFHHNEIITGDEMFWKATWHLLFYESFPYSYIGTLNWTSWQSAGPRGLGTSIPWIWIKIANIHYTWMHS